MKNQINIAEILKDCPKGMELDCTICNGVKFIELDRNPNFPIVIRANNGYEFTLTKYGQVHNIDDAKCVIFPKGKTTWEGFTPPYEFKDGDIVTWKDGMGSLVACIYKERLDMSFSHHIALYKGGLGIIVNGEIILTNDELRLATEEEKKKLFDAIKENGYKWNPETKTLEKVIQPKFKVGDRIKNKNVNLYHTVKEILGGSYIVDNNSVLDMNMEHLYELAPDIKPKFKVGDRIRKKGDYISGAVTEIDIDYFYKVVYDGGAVSYVNIDAQDDWELVPNKFDIATLKPFDKVLVRLREDYKWRCSLFSHMDEDLHTHCYKYVVITGKSYPMCIPYEGNEHLLGTPDDCDEYYKTW